MSPQSLQRLVPEDYFFEYHWCILITNQRQLGWAKSFCWESIEFLKLVNLKQIRKAAISFNKQEYKCKRNNDLWTKQ